MSPFILLALLCLPQIQTAMVTNIHPGVCPSETDCEPVYTLGSTVDIRFQVEGAWRGDAVEILFARRANGRWERVPHLNATLNDTLFERKAQALSRVSPGAWRLEVRLPATEESFFGGWFRVAPLACVALPDRERRKRDETVAAETRKRQMACTLSSGAIDGKCVDQVQCTTTAQPSSTFVTGCESAPANIKCCANDAHASWGDCRYDGLSKDGVCKDEASCHTTAFASRSGQVSGCNAFPGQIKCCPERATPRPTPRPTPVPTPVTECAPGFYGASCTRCPICFTGNCDDGRTGTGDCVCSDGFTGFTCSSCVDGRYGFSCKSVCSECSGHGTCDDGRFGTGDCDCQSGWKGAQCAEKIASVCPTNQFGTPPNCQQCPACFVGDCDQQTGKCNCPTGTAGTTCALCADGYFGSDCTRCPSCVFGRCDDGVFGSGTCSCFTGFAGPLCTLCQNGFYGNSCLSCGDCGRGQCDDGASGSGDCVCDVGWTRTGSSRKSKCDKCADGFEGPNCTPKATSCPLNTYGKDCKPCKPCTAGGYCSAGLNGTGDCVCFIGSTGEQCELCETGRWGTLCRPCPNCGLHGSCRDGIDGDGRCVCKDGYTGVACEIAPDAPVCIDDNERCLDSDPRCPRCVKEVPPRAGTCVPSSAVCETNGGDVVSGTGDLLIGCGGEGDASGVVCCVAQRSDSAPEPSDAPVQFEWPKNETVQQALPVAIGQRVHVSWTGGVQAGLAERDTLQLIGVSSFDIAQDVALRSGAADFVMLHSDDGKSLQPGDYRLRFKGRAAQLSGLLTVVAAGCTPPVLGECVERNLCVARGASWTQAMGECRGFDDNIVCCTNTLQAGEFEVQTSEALPQRTAAPTPVPTTAAPATTTPNLVFGTETDALELPFYRTTLGYIIMASAGLLCCGVILCLVICACVLASSNRKQGRNDQYVMANSLYHDKTAYNAQQRQQQQHQSRGATIEMRPQQSSTGTINSFGAATTHELQRPPSALTPVYNTKPQPAYSVNGSYGNNDAYPVDALGGGTIGSSVGTQSVGMPPVTPYYNNPDDNEPGGYQGLPMEAGLAGVRQLPGVPMMTEDDNVPGSYTPLPAHAQTLRNH